VADDLFEHPRLAAIYDALESDRSDLEVYAAIADELGARRVLAVGCAIGTFCLLLAERGREVTVSIRPTGSLAVARAKPGSERVNFVHGSARALPPMQVDLPTRTGNVSQAIVHPTDWEGTLRGIKDALRPGGDLVFETRDPASRAWLEWNRAATQQITEIEGVGAVQTWVEVIDVSGPLVTFRGTYVFASRTGFDLALDTSFPRARRDRGGFGGTRLHPQGSPKRARPARAGICVLCAPHTVRRTRRSNATASPQTGGSCVSSWPPTLARWAEPRVRRR
jgi:SAM-dependent methyltransferase